MSGNRGGIMAGRCGGEWGARGKGGRCGGEGGPGEKGEVGKGREGVIMGLYDSSFSEYTNYFTTFTILC